MTQKHIRHVQTTTKHHQLQVGIITVPVVPVKKAFPSSKVLQVSRKFGRVVNMSHTPSSTSRSTLRPREFVRDSSCAEYRPKVHILFH